MIVYSSMLIISIILGAAILKENNKIIIKKACIVLEFLLLFLIMGLRYGVGQDYFFTYKPVFEYILKYGTYSNIEYGFVILNKIVQFFTTDYAGIFLITSFLFVFFIYKAIVEKSANIILSIYLLITSCFYFYAMNVVRQSIVIAIFIYSLKFIEEKNLKKYIIYILFGSLIHKIALIFIPIYFFANRKISFKRFLTITLVIILCISIILQIITLVLKGTKYENYINGKYVVNEKSMISPLINLCLLVTCFLIKDSCENDSRLNIYKNIHMIGFWVSLFIGTIPLISRIFVNFYHIQLLSIPLIITKFKKNSTRQILYLLCFFIFLLNFIYSVGIKNGNNVLPYKTLFSR